MASKPPNILFIQTDNQRWDTLGCSGNPIIQTPNVDRLAAGGVYFPNAFATTPICAASRASILTGLFRRRHDFTFRQPPFRAEFAAISYPTLLRQAGYYTGLIGKFGIATYHEIIVEGGEATLAKMFDHFDNYEHWNEEGYWIKQEDGSRKHLTEITGDKVIDFLRTRPDDQPFCLSVSFNAPHAQDPDPQNYYPPNQELHLYDEETIPQPGPTDPAFFEALPKFLRENESRKRWHLRWTSAEHYQRTIKGYWGMISGVDRMVGRFVAELERLGVAEDTVIIYTSDHGFLVGERGYSDCWLLYENSMRVPLVIYDPRADGSAQGIAPDQMALNIDLSPTILELAGIEVPEMVQGKSLVALMRGEEPQWREDFFCEHLFTIPRIIIPRCEGVRSPKWKYIRYIDEDPVYEELYDLEKDAEEVNNLRDDPAYAGELTRLRNRCDELLSEAKGP